MKKENNLTAAAAAAADTADASMWLLRHRAHRQQHFREYKNTWNRRQPTDHRELKSCLQDLKKVNNN